MLPTQKECDEKYFEIVNETFVCKLITQIYAKWYAEQVIKHCAEVAEIKMVKHPYIGNLWEVNKQSILNVINEL
jgi:hypothetical protein